MPGAVILVVVERLEQRVLFNQLLRGSAHRLIFALNGEDGLERFAEVKPDLMIAHVHAPKLDAAILCQPRPAAWVNERLSMRSPQWGIPKSCAI